MDDIDRAQAREALDTSLAIDAQRRRGIDRDSRGVCVDCGEPIEPARIRILGATCRCAECAHLAEQRARLA